MKKDMMKRKIVFFMKLIIAKSIQELHSPRRTWKIEESMMNCMSSMDS